MPALARRLLVALCIGGGAGLLVAGCSGDTPPSNDFSVRATTPSRQNVGGVRTDLAPLTKRFTALGQPVSATWTSSTLGGAAPGPSTYRLDAVVSVSPSTANRLRAANPQPTTEQPQLDSRIRAHLPAGTLLRSPALDALFAEGSFRAKVYLAADSDTVVLAALGQ
ncbi:MAG: hypothetical protein L0H96_08620 [Humibacillus sp.]|nr:hypothetical protein [Humibacillus sp.]MDN5776959.1 hypothetical protein [Humibacillus sp.]